MPKTWFITGASSGLGLEMTQQLLERALYDMQQWRRAGMNLYLSVNLTTQHLEQPALAESVLGLLEKYQLPTVALRFEITESALMRDQQSAIRTMQSLSDAGIKLALDDFGTGYSNLSYLRSFNATTLKIDRSFISSLCLSERDEPLVQAIINMAASLGLKTVAEGVEDAATLNRLLALGCDEGQGFFWSPAVAESALPELLQRQF